MTATLLGRLASVLWRGLIHPVTLFVIVVLTGLVGFAIATAAPDYAARLARAERLRPSSAAAIADGAPGQEVLVEGRISPRSTPVYGSFVAYVREVYRSAARIDTDEEHRWEELERATPPLLIALPDGEVRVSNSDYTLETSPAIVTESQPTLTRGTVRSRGYTVGDNVLIFGSVVSDGGGRAVSAESLYAGTRADYLAEYRRLSSSALPIAAPFLLVCAISLAALVWQVRRFMREDAAQQAELERSRAAQPRSYRRKHKQK